jgi:single-stranded-DNA-specific exonuclease
MRTRAWHLIESSPELSHKISAKLGVSPLLAQLLLNRNIRSLDHAKSFLDPTLTANYQFEHADFMVVLDLVRRCIAHRRQIVVYGDYDVDGMTSTTMMVHVLRGLGAKVAYYIPHRFVDGYGLNVRILPQLIEMQTALLLTLDCGVSNVEEIAIIKEAGMSVVVMDHHQLPDVLPPTDMMINPRFYSTDHPLAPLCTAGIVYKFIEFLALHDESVIPDLYIDLAALGTIADVAALTGENRRIVSTGLRYLSRSKWPGIQALKQVANLDKPSVTVRDVGFSIAPRLNAAGRLGHAKMGVDLLLSDTVPKAMALAVHLQQLNESRQAIGTAIMHEATQAVGAEVGPVVVLDSDTWHAGVIGIIASRLVEKYGVPAVLIAVQDGLGRGSARTSGHVNIYELLKTCRPFFKTFGGHKEAAGFSILPDQIEPFKRALNLAAQEFVKPEDLVTVVSLDGVLGMDDMTLGMIHELGALGPFGQGNPIPAFYSRELRVLEAKLVGNGQHIKVTFTDRTGSRVVDGIGFGMGDRLEMIYQPNIEIAFQLESNEWNGRVSPQLQLMDCRVG